MLTLAYVVPIALGVLFEWPRGSKILSAFVVIIVACMVGACTDHADYLPYLAQYRTASPSLGLFSEPLWETLMFLFRSLGFPYEAFAAIQTGLLLALILLGSRLLHVSSPFLLATLLTYPGLLGFVQLRQLLAIAVVFLAFALLLSRRRFGLAWYLALVAVAGLIHVTAFFMIVVPFLTKLNYHKGALVVFVLAIIASSFSSDWMRELARQLFTDDVSQAYLAGYVGVANDLSRVFTVFEVLGSLALLCAAKRWGTASDPAMGEKAFAVLLPLNLLFVALIPLLMVNTDFLRLNRYVLLLSMAVVGNFSPLCESAGGGGSGRVKLAVGRLSTFGFYGVLFYGLIWMQVPDSVVGAMLQW